MSWPITEDEQVLFRRLLAREPGAPARFSATYLDVLIEWLQATHPDPDDHLHQEAAVEALISLFKNPSSFDPKKGKSLASYLKMSAAADFKNILRRERKHKSGRKSLDDVEVDSAGGNYFGREDEPGRNLELEEEGRKAEEQILAVVKNGLSLEELAGLELYIDGERRTEPYAKVLNLLHSTPGEREAAVKKLKDKIKARIARARGLHVEPS